MIKYICVEECKIPFCVDDRGNTKKFYIIKKGSQWNLDPALSGTDWKLKNNKNEDVLIDISNEALENCFVQMIDEATLFDSYDGPRTIVLPKTISEYKIMEEAKKCFEKYCDEYLDEDHDYYLDDEYSEIGIKRAMFEGDMTDTVTDIEKETLYKVWQVKINEYPF